MAFYKILLYKVSFLVMLFFVISLSGCLSNWSGYEDTDNDGGIDDKDVIFTMKFKESSGWSEHEDWGRWYYEDQKELYDLSKMLADNKVYLFSYSFRSDIDISSLGVNFFNTDDPPGWKMITNWTWMIGNVKKYTKYSGKVVIIPRTNAAGCDPKNTYMNFDMGNRNVSVPATLSFYEFKLEQISKEPIGIETWTISGKVFKISEPEKTFAEILPTFNGKTNVLHIKPTYSAYGIDYYGDPVIQYDLSDFAKEKIEIDMSMDVYLKKKARIAWQVNSPDPYYPVICGTVPPDDRFPYNSDPNPLPENKWHDDLIKGSNTIIVPTTSGTTGKLLYLSGQQIEGAEAYFANAEITISVATLDVNYSVTANGSPSEPKNTTQLTLEFDQAITDLKKDDITISGVDRVIKGKLKPIDSDSETVYTLDISGFTSSGTLTITVKKDGYNISDSPQTVDIIYSAFDSAVGLKGLTTGSGDVITVDTNTGIITKKIDSGWGNYFSVAIPAKSLPINASNKIVVTYIGFGDAQLMPKLPNSYNDVNPQVYPFPTFIGDETVRIYKIDASRYEAKMPNTPNAVLTFQGVENNPVAWKLKIIDITIE